MGRVPSRERMLQAISGGSAQTPCSFMIFRALRAQCRDELDFAERQTDLGLDARVQLDDLPVHVTQQTRITEWVESAAAGEPVLCRAYETPAGTLTARAKKTEDWPYGSSIPIFDDFFPPRAVQYPVASEQHLEVLRQILADPSAEEIAAFRAQAAERTRFARAHGLLLSGGWKSQRFVPGEDKHLVGDNGGTGAVIDVLMWLCGGTQPLLWAHDQPEFLRELITTIERWNRRRLEIHLEVGVDLVVRRAWYEGTEFWSPGLFRQCILPGLKQDATMAHQAGAVFGYIVTSGILPIAAELIESGVDAIIGVDPGEGKGTTLAGVRDALGGKVGLWGGVSGPFVVENGTEDDVRAAVREALDTLAGTGRFILSPVDNVRADTPQAWRSVKVLIQTWREGTSEV
ncbi:MAG: uroporphyrinogen decarboxylase family protein [Armatimonadota bacterium]